MKEYFGIGSINKLQEVLAEIQPKTIFLVTGKKVYQASGADKTLDPLLKPYKVAVFNDFEENPKLEDIKKGIAVFKKNDFDLVIAVGGGSPMDMAKAINILAVQKGDPSDYVTGRVKMAKAGKPLAAIPTTSGTGSEATHFAVVYIDHKKYSLADERILPDYAIIDPELTFSLPAKITAATGMDALSQGIESYWSNQSTEESKEYAREAIVLAIGNLAQAVNHPAPKNRIAMSRAAHLSGKAINVSRTTAPHAISYAFTTFFAIPHGHAVGLTLASLLVYNSQVTPAEINDKRGLEYIKNTMREIIELLGVKDAVAAKAVLDSLMKKIGLKTRLRDIGFDLERDTDLIAKNVNLERVSKNPRQLTADYLKNLCKQLY